MRACRVFSYAYASCVLNADRDKICIIFFKKYLNGKEKSVL